MYVIYVCNYLSDLSNLILSYPILFSIYSSIYLSIYLSIYPIFLPFLINLYLFFVFLYRLIRINLNLPLFPSHHHPLPPSPVHRLLLLTIGRLDTWVYLVLQFSNIDGLQKKSECTVQVLHVYLWERSWVPGKWWAAFRRGIVFLVHTHAVLQWALAVPEDQGFETWFTVFLRENRPRRSHESLLLRDNGVWGVPNLETMWNYSDDWLRLSTWRFG